ncbi:Rid family hydrolase [Cohnella soli]|uniref:Rid family hydrolase n=1 Tax=Cohnella soli TaxID=425005 RepID=A0ABW0I1G5_9BACL
MDGEAQIVVRASSGSPYENKIGFSRAVRKGSYFVVAGTAPIDESGATVVTVDAYDQMKCCIRIVKRAIEDLGGSLDHVIRTRIILTSIDDWELAAKAHHEFFAAIRPVTTVFSVDRFIRKEWKVELEAEGFIS